MGPAVCRLQSENGTATQTAHENVHTHIVPGKPSKGTHIKGTIKRGWVVAQQRCLDGSTTPMQASILDAKTTEPGYQTTLHCHFTHANVCYLQCVNVVLKVKNVVNKATDWCV